MSDSVRKQDRLPRDFELVWAVTSLGLSGRATFVNVSIGGACIELNQVVALERGSAVSLVCSKIPALPSMAKVLWVRKSRATSTLCGLSFAAQGSSWATWIAAQQPVLTR